MPSLLTLPILLSEWLQDHTAETSYSRFPPRVAPVLKEAISSGKINLTAIVNTHQ